MSDFSRKLTEPGHKDEAPEDKPPNVPISKIREMAHRAFSREPSNEYEGGGVLVQDDKHLDVDEDAPKTRG